MIFSISFKPGILDKVRSLFIRFVFIYRPSHRGARASTVVMVRALVAHLVEAVAILAVVIPVATLAAADLIAMTRILKAKFVSFNAFPLV